MQHDEVSLLWRKPSVKFNIIDSVLLNDWGGRKRFHKQESLVIHARPSDRQSRTYNFKTVRASRRKGHILPESKKFNSQPAIKYASQTIRQIVFCARFRQHTKGGFNRGVWSCLALRIDLVARLYYQQRWGALKETTTCPQITTVTNQMVSILITWSCVFLAFSPCHFF